MVGASPDDCGDREAMDAMHREDSAALSPDDRAFLEREFDHWADSYFRNEALGEQRLSFFVGLVTTVLGGLTYLLKDKDLLALDRSARLIAAVATLGLFGLGLLTLFRLVRRNRVTDGCLRALGEIRRLLV